jgi:hypothetical protein
MSFAMLLAWLWVLGFVGIDLGIRIGIVVSISALAVVLGVTVIVFIALIALPAAAVTFAGPLTSA